MNTAREQLGQIQDTEQGRLQVVKSPRHLLCPHLCHGIAGRNLTRAHGDVPVLHCQGGVALRVNPGDLVGSLNTQRLPAVVFAHQLAGARLQFLLLARGVVGIAHGLGNVDLAHGKSHRQVVNGLGQCLQGRLCPVLIATMALPGLRAPQFRTQPVRYLRPNPGADDNAGRIDHQVGDAGHHPARGRDDRARHVLARHLAGAGRSGDAGL